MDAERLTQQIKGILGDAPFSLGTTADGAEVTVSAPVSKEQRAAVEALGSGIHVWAAEEAGAVKDAAEAELNAAKDDEMVKRDQIINELLTRVSALETVVLGLQARIEKLTAGKADGA